MRRHQPTRSDKTLPILEELCNANESEGGGVIVILADMLKEEMEERIEGEDMDLRGSIVVCRGGSPISMVELRKVCPQLSCVVVAAPYTWRSRAHTGQVGLVFGRSWRDRACNCRMRRRIALANKRKLLGSTTSY